MNIQPLRDVPLEIINEALFASLQNLEQIAIEESMQQNPEYYIKKVISEEGLKTIKKIRFNSIQHTDTFCPITQEEFNNNEEILELPCKHYFSSYAILNWLHNEKAECPLCRYKFPYITISKNTYIRIRRINRVNTTNQIPTQEIPIPQHNPRQITRTSQPPVTRSSHFIMPFNIRRNNIRSIAHWRNTMNGVIQR